MQKLLAMFGCLALSVCLLSGTGCDKKTEKKEETKKKVEEVKKDGETVKKTTEEVKKTEETKKEEKK